MLPKPTNLEAEKEDKLNRELSTDSSILKEVKELIMECQ
jgi:hypothetical protein